MVAIAAPGDWRCEVSVPIPSLPGTAFLLNYCCAKATRPAGITSRWVHRTRPVTGSRREHDGTSHVHPSRSGGGIRAKGEGPNPGESLDPGVATDEETKLWSGGGE